MPPSDAAIRRSFGQRIAAARNAAGLSQRDVAVALTAAGATTSAQAVSQWEAGKSSPRPRSRLTLAGILHVSATDLFDLAGITDDDETAA